MRATIEYLKNAAVVVGVGLVAFYVLSAVVLVPFPLSWIVIIVPEAILAAILFHREWKKDKWIIQQITNPWFYDLDAQAEKYLASRLKEASDKSHED